MFIVTELMVNGESVSGCCWALYSPEVLGYTVPEVLGYTVNIGRI